MGRVEEWGCFECVMLGLGKGSSSQARGGCRTFKEVRVIKFMWNVERSGIKNPGPGVVAPDPGGTPLT
jgi:hypothetical protein